MIHVEDIMKAVLLLLLFICMACTSVLAMTQPDISAIGDFRAFTGNYKDAYGNETMRNGNLNMRFEGLEFAINGNLNPYTRADIAIANHGDGFEVEEAYATILRGLPLGAQIKGGRYLVDFGKLNTYHPHAYPFVDRPIALRMMFGFDGFIDEGVNVSFLLPVGFYSKLSLNALRGKIFEPDPHAHDEEEEPEGEHIEGRNTEDPIFSGRLNGFFPIGEKGNLEIGVSGLYGMYAASGAEDTGNEIDGYHDLWATMYGVDIKYKHRWSDYSSLILHGELLGSRRDRFAPGWPIETVSTLGGFFFADLQFSKRYNIGAMVDLAPGIFDGGEHDYNPVEPLANTETGIFDDLNRTTSFTLFTGFSLLEETTVIRLFGRLTSFDDKRSSQRVSTEYIPEKADEYTVGLQLLWSLGPHKPHQF